MHENQTSLRSLHDRLLEYQGQTCYFEVLIPWLEANKEVSEWLRSFSQRSGTPIPEASVEELWRLYALSRVLELLTLQFQHGTADGNWPGHDVSLQQFESFAEALGLQVENSNVYHPFEHEIVGLKPSSAILPKIIQCHWPGLMLGNMRIMRAGVTVSASPKVLLPGVADASTLYWAYRRKNRPYCDLSQGWGSNSSWRTSFRRDYRIGNALYFNVDGSVDLSLTHPTELDETTLNRAERTELLINRSFVITTKPHDDLWPYKDRICLINGI